MYFNFSKRIFSSAPRVFRSVSKTVLLFSIIFIIGSCKKDITVERYDIHNKEVKQITNISYAKFLESIDVDKVPLFKILLSKPSEGKTSSSSSTLMAINEDSNNFNIDMGNVKKLVLGDTISYVIALRPKTKRASHFENITIQVLNGNTTAFLSVYIPTKDWIIDWKGPKHLPFKGTVFINRINLVNIPLLQNLSNSKSSSKGPTMSINEKSTSTEAISINNNRISLMPGECEFYDLLELVPYQCSTGDWPGSCAWETNISSMSDLQHLPGWRMERTPIINCAPMPVPSHPAPPSGGGGGGGTTPNPPGDYNPCDGDIPVASSIGKRGGIIKLSGVPPSDCDEQTPTLPTYAPEVQGLITFLDLRDGDLTYAVNNQDIATHIYLALLEEGFSYEDKLAAKMTIQAGAANMFGLTNALAHYNAIQYTLPNAQLIDPAIVRMYFSIQCAMVRLDHPEYPEWKIYMKASSEMVHLLLDGVGLIPGVGEIADLTSGFIYTLEGEGVNATLSYTSAIPFIGWASAGAKMARKTLIFADGSRTTLKWTKKIGNLVNFGDPRQLRRVMLKSSVNLAGKDAHHIIPWGLQTHQIIQKAAKRDGLNPFHLNNLINGIGLDNVIIHSGNHPTYTNNVKTLLDAIPLNISADETYNQIILVINRVRTAIVNNPNVKINDLIF
jgi:hypothetical protein